MGRLWLQNGRMIHRPDTGRVCKGETCPCGFLTNCQCVLNYFAVYCLGDRLGNPRWLTAAELAGVRLVYPSAPGSWFNSTDQDVVATKHAALDPETQYTLKVFCDNAGVVTRAEHTFTTPAAPVNPLWYVPRLAILKRLKQAGLETAAVTVLAEDKWKYEYWSASLEVACNDTVIRAMLTRMGANPDGILAPWVPDTPF